MNFEYVLRLEESLVALSYFAFLRTVSKSLFSTIFALSSREHWLQTAHYGPQDCYLPRAAVKCLPYSSGDSTPLLSQKQTNDEDNEAGSGQR